MSERSGGVAAPDDQPRPAGWRTRLIARLWTTAFRLQLATWRKEVHDLDRLDDRMARGQPVLVAFWHGKYTPLFALLRGRKAVAFTSLSFRGAVIGEICRRFGYRPVQLPDHGRDESLERMRRELRTATTCGIAVDGPLGPYHVVKRGPVQLASDLGFVVLPMTFAARRSRIAADRWDRMEVPSLFTRVVFLVGEPLQVPKDLDPDGVQQWCTRVRYALEALDIRAAELV